MLIEKLKGKYVENTPIFADEILNLCKEYSRAYVFRMIKNELDLGNLCQYSRGVYYIPSNTIFGKSTICSEMVAQKKYIKDDKSIYGLYSGLSLLNNFGFTDQVPYTIEIVTNNETTRKRNVDINNRKFVLHKSRCEITNENYPTYTLLQLFNDLDKKDQISEYSYNQIMKYIRDYEITIIDIFSMSKYFPSSTLKRIVESGVINNGI